MFTPTNAQKELTGFRSAAAAAAAAAGCN